MCQILLPWNLKARHVTEKKLIAWPSAVAAHCGKYVSVHPRP